MTGFRCMVSSDDELVSEPHLLKSVLEEVPSLRRPEIRKTLVATEGDEMEVSAIVLSDKALRRAPRIDALRRRPCSVETGRNSGAPWLREGGAPRYFGKNFCSSPGAHGS